MDKNAIKKFATWARRELIDRVRQQAYRYEVEEADAVWNASTAARVKGPNMPSAVIPSSVCRVFTSSPREPFFTVFMRYSSYVSRLRTSTRLMELPCSCRWRSRNNCAA